MEHEPDFLLLQYDEMDDGFLSARSPQFQRLLSRFNPDWIILSDADERWMTRTGSLRDEPTLQTCDIVVVSRFNVPLTATLEQSIDRLGLDREVTCDIIVDGPTAAEELFADENDVAWAPTLDGPRVMFRTGAAERWEQGLHGVFPGRSNLSIDIARDVFVAHIPFTTENRFLRKLASVNEYIKKSQGRADKGGSWHWRRWSEVYERGGGSEEYRRQIVSDEELSQARAKRQCVPLNEVFFGGYAAEASQAYRLLGVHQARTGRPAAAEKAFRDALRLKPDDPQFHLDLTAVLFAARRLEEAELCARPAVKLAPSKAEARHALRNVLVARGQWDLALIEAKEAARLAPKTAQFHWALADLFERSGDIDEAEEALRAALRQAPEDVAAHMKLMEFLVHHGRKQEAMLAALESACTAACPNALHLVFGGYLAQTGDLCDAEAVLRRAVDLGQCDPISYRALIDVLLRQKRNGEARAVAQQALTHASASADYCLQVGQLFAERGGSIDGLELLGPYLASDPGLREFRLMATLLERSGRLDEALAAAREAAAVEPQAPEHHHFLASMLLRAKALDEALGVLQSATQRWPHDAPLLRLLSDALRQRGDTEGAIAKVREALALEPNNGDYRVHLGFLLFQSGEVAQARSILEEAVRLAPNHAFGRRMLSGALWRAGAREAALAEARRAVELQPKWAELNAHLGHLLVETGALAEAEPVVRRALEAAPDHVHARRLMERLEAARKKAAAAVAGAKV
jgi:tetratricopeptide (TPR) repeat protein